MNVLKIEIFYQKKKITLEDINNIIYQAFYSIINKNKILSHISNLKI